MWWNTRDQGPRTIERSTRDQGPRTTLKRIAKSIPTQLLDRKSNLSKDDRSFKTQITIAIITTLTRPYDLHVWEVEARNAAKRKIEKEDTPPEQVPFHSYGKEEA